MGLSSGYSSIVPDRIRIWKVLVFVEKGKPENPAEEKHSEPGRESKIKNKINPSHLRRWVRDSNPGLIS